MFFLFKPKSLLSAATGGLSNLIPGLKEEMPKTAKVPGAAASAAADTAAADEAARKLRAKEKLRTGAQASLTSNATAGQFASAGSGKRSLLG